MFVTIHHIIVMYESTMDGSMARDLQTRTMLPCGMDGAVRNPKMKDEKWSTPTLYIVTWPPYKPSYFFEVLPEDG